MVSTTFRPEDGGAQIRGFRPMTGQDTIYLNAEPADPLLAEKAYRLGWK